MARIVNVRRDVDDKFYRYKMPELLTKIEGKGNGIKTVLPNISDVSKSLSRPPSYATKFFGCELGAQTPMDEKNDRYIVNGAHEASRLRELLDVYIDKFVLCGSCKNPETDLILVTKEEYIYRDCKACGTKSDIDMRHKLASYIIRNPPKNSKGKKSKGAHASASATNGDAEEGDGGDDDDDALMKKFKSDAADLPTQPSKLEAEDWSLDTSADAVRARAKLVGSMGGLSLDDDEEEDGADSPYSQLKVWASENKSVSAVEVYKKAQELGVEKKHKSLLILGRALFTEDVVNELPNYMAMFKKMVTSEKHQKALMGGIEQLVGLDHPQLVPAAVPKILMVFYQADVLDEEFCKSWGTHVSKKYVEKEVSKRVRKAAEPFLKWLDEAEDEDSEEDDD
ncbi:hypothetical protein DL93DRAFT_2123841 [Clavulina sp. PMI_390]|nr:hypothetical protein DL93DRAFT_2123841 [Clavulina sp. PMI_390]